MREKQRGVDVDTQDKDTCEFESIYRKYKMDVFKASMRYSGNNEQISLEMTHNVFLKLHDNLNVIEQKYLVQWLTTTSKNMTINYMKRAQREISCEDVTPNAERKKSEKSPEDLFFDDYRKNEREELARRILDELYEINDRWYEAVTKAYCLDMPQKEVANELGISITVLHSILHRAKTWILKKYEQEIKNMDD